MVRWSSPAVVVLFGFLVWPRVATAASLTLAWDPPTDGITTGYVLLYGIKSGAYSTQVDVGNTTSYTVTGLAAGRTYYFTVQARSAAGLLSAPAAEVTGTTPGISPRASSAGDLNDDHVQDLLFQSTAGDLYGWYMSGTSLVSGAWLSPAQIDPEWRAVTVRDFTGDGHADLLLQNQSTGAAKIRRMVDLAMTDDQDLPIAANSPWKIVGSADLNADGYPDIVWQNATAGQVYVWYMKPNGDRAGFAGTAGAFSGDYLRDANQQVVTLGPTTRHIVGTGDMNGDGSPDLVWQDSQTNELGVWYLNGLTRTSEAPVTPQYVAPTWKLRLVGDYNEDGWPDLLFQNAASGDLYAWFMTGSSLAYGEYLIPRTISTIWRMVGP